MKNLQCSWSMLILIEPLFDHCETISGNCLMQSMNHVKIYKKLQSGSFLTGVMAVILNVKIVYASGLWPEYISIINNLQSITHN